MTSLRQRMLEDMQVRRRSPCTQQTYVETVARFARYFGRSPARLGPEEIRAYQVYLTNERRLAPSSLVVAVSALRFLYRVTLRKRWTLDDAIPAPKKPRSLPVVLSPEEVVQFLDGVKAAKHRAILTTCYAAGLRIAEAVRLTVSAIDSERMVLRIAKGKGEKDRYVMLSPKLLEVLRAWWKVDRPRHWLFPGERPEMPITRGAVQRACQIAIRRARLAKPVSPHALRHAFAVHTPRSGHRPTHDSAPARASESADHGALPAGRHHQGLLDHESAGPAPTARTMNCGQSWLDLRQRVVHSVERRARAPDSRCGRYHTQVTVNSVAVFMVVSSLPSACECPCVSSSPVQSFRSQRASPCQPETSLGEAETSIDSVVPARCRGTVLGDEHALRGLDGRFAQRHQKLGHLGRATRWPSKEPC